jgi:hypothetical protein
MGDFMGGLYVSKIRNVIAEDDSIRGLQRTDIWFMRIFILCGSYGTSELTNVL